MRGYTNAAGGGGGTLASIAFDRDAFIGYLVGLGSVVADVEEIDDFINSLAYSFASGSISADKFVTKGNNLMPRLDSFEKEAGRSILMYPQTGVTNAAINVVPSDGYYPAPYGTAVLKITTPNTTGPFGFYLNPYYADASRWIDLGKLDYWFSYYLYTTSPLSVTGSIKLISSFGDEVVVPFSITQSQGWVRFSDYFNLEANDSLSLYITINETDRNLYLDAIQVEPKYITTTEPSTFAPGGKVVIDGGNIRANSISAENAVFSTGAIIDADIANLNAAKIDAGIINTNVVTVGDYDRGLMTMYDNNISFYEPIDANTEKLRVSIGKLDTPGSTWGLKVLGTDGTSVLFNENGLTSLGTTEGLTKASYIDENLDIYGSKLRANSVDGAAKIVAQSITAGSIATNAIIARTIDANAITATKIAAETINATHLNSNIVTGKLIQLGETTVTAGIDGAGDAAARVRFWAGADYDNKATAPFRVTQDGSLYASSATITGSITSTSGTIGDFTITDTKLYSSFGGTYVGLSNNTNGYSIWVGSQNPVGAPFRVKTNGDMYAAGFLFGWNFTSAHNVILGENIMLDDYDAGMIGFGVNVSTPTYYIRGGTNGLYVKGHFLPDKNNTYDIGNGTVRWRQVFSAAADNISSDIRLKENVSVVNHEYDQMILNTEIITYNLIGSDVEQIGINANAFHEKFGEAAKYITTLGEDGYYGATYTNFIPMLIKTIQALNKRIEALEEKWNS